MVTYFTYQNIYKLHNIVSYSKLGDKKKSKKKVKLTRKDLNKYLGYAILLGFFLIIFRDYALLIIVCAFLSPLGWITLFLSRFVPKVNIETIHASSILLGVIFGPKTAFWWGLLTATAGYVFVISKIKMTTIANSFFMASMGFVSYFIYGWVGDFRITFLLTYVYRAVFGVIIFPMVGSDPVGVVTHSFIDSTFNILITIHFMNFLFNLLSKFACAACI